MISTNQSTVSWQIWTKMTPLCCWKWNLTGASAVQRNPVRKRGLTRKQVILLPRYSPRIPPSRQVGTVAKVNKLAETKLQPSSCASHLISSPNQEISSVDIPSPVSSDFSYQGQVYYETEWPGESVASPEGWQHPRTRPRPQWTCWVCTWWSKPTTASRGWLPHPP